MCTYISYLNRIFISFPLRFFIIIFLALPHCSASSSHVVLWVHHPKTQSASPAEYVHRKCETSIHIILLSGLLTRTYTRKLNYQKHQLWKKERKRQRADGNRTFLSCTYTQNFPTLAQCITTAHLSECRRWAHCCCYYWRKRTGRDTKINRRWNHYSYNA